MIAGETLWVYKRTIELKGKTGFQQVMEPLYAQMVAADAAEDPSGKSANELEAFDYWGEPESVTPGEPEPEPDGGNDVTLI
jgi:hypothetical protein